MFMLPALLLSAASAPAQAAPVDYALKGKLYVQVYKDPTTIAQALAHDHVIQASGWTGTATWDPESASACQMAMVVPVNSLVVDEEQFRRGLGYDTFPSVGEREDIRKEMLGDAVLEADEFPQIIYKATSCEEKDGRVWVKGDLTIHGVTKNVTLPMTVKADSVNFSAKGSLKIKASDFGMEPYSAGFGALKNQDSMILAVDVHGEPKK